MLRINFFIVFALLITCICGSINAQNVYFTDREFRDYLLGNDKINTNGDNYIQISEAQAYTGTISIQYRDIYSLSGIEEFTNISGLNCGNNRGVC